MNKAISLIFSQKTRFQYFPASIYMSNFLVIVSSRESCDDNHFKMQSLTKLGDPQKDWGLYWASQSLSETRVKRLLTTGSWLVV